MANADTVDHSKRYLRGHFCFIYIFLDLPDAAFFNLLFLRGYKTLNYDGSKSALRKCSAVRQVPSLALCPFPLLLSQTLMIELMANILLQHQSSWQTPQRFPQWQA